MFLIAVWSWCLFLPTQKTVYILPLRFTSQFYSFLVFERIPTTFVTSTVTICGIMYIYQLACVAKGLFVQKLAWMLVTLCDPCMARYICYYVFMVVIITMLICCFLKWGCFKILHWLSSNNGCHLFYVNCTQLCGSWRLVLGSGSGRIITHWCHGSSNSLPELPHAN